MHNMRMLNYNPLQKAHDIKPKHNLKYTKAHVDKPTKNVMRIQLVLVGGVWNFGKVKNMLICGMLTLKTYPPHTFT